MVPVYGFVHTTCGMPAQTGTDIRGVDALTGKTTSSQGLEQDSVRQGFNTVTSICKPLLRLDKRTADLILKHDKLIFILLYLLWLNIN